MTNHICILSFETTETLPKEITAISSLLYKKNENDQYYQFHEAFRAECIVLVNNHKQVGDSFPDILNKHIKWLKATTNDDFIFMTNKHSLNIDQCFYNECCRWNIYPPLFYTAYYHFDIIEINGLPSCYKIAENFNAPKNLYTVDYEHYVNREKRKQFNKFAFYRSEFTRINRNFLLQTFEHSL